MNWKKIGNPEDPEWMEWHLEVMSKEFGRVKLKVWLSTAGCYRASCVRPGGGKGSVMLNSKTEPEAKIEALDWVEAQ